ncbi:uncharacterized protein LOC115611033 [Strigops habroptila]|uniref:uncharacterized protein LOC115611033 n=1 Tax=Strigops habroptila TaxID=2489341 RepID=UPI0011CF5956|nr:uncharacterized protein LOC115611033 [Strigops habroptila]
MGWNSGLCCSPMLLAAGSVWQSPLRRLLESLHGIDTPEPTQVWPAAASGMWGAVGTGTRDHSPTAAGVTAPAMPTQSPSETQVLGASSTATPRDPHHACSTWPPARPPTMGTVTKRPFAEVGAVSPEGSSTCTGGCDGASSPKKSDPRGSPPAPQQPLGEAQHPRAEVGRAPTIVVEELERLCQELGSVRQEVCGVRSHLAQLERGWARELAALTRGHRHLRRAIRHLQRQCWALETRSRLPHGAGDASAVTSLQSVLLPALAQPRLHGLLRFTNKPALLQAACGCPEPPRWAGAHLAIVPIACPHHCLARFVADRFAWRVLEPRCSTRCPAASHGQGSVGL